jgi:HAD superfamily hydrolase (TIGR01509 family)
LYREQSIGGVARKYGLTYGPEMKKRVYEIYFGLIAGRLTAFPGVYGLLGRLRVKKIPLAVASSADRIKIEANLKAIEVDPEWFRATVAGNEVPRMKPAPDVYLAAAEKLGADPANCCVIEDSISGIRAAKAAGMRCVAVAQSFAASELRTASPDCIRPDVGKIPLIDLGLSMASG